jgi:trigger factor
MPGNLTGFRKAVPKDLVEKQYGKQSNKKFKSSRFGARAFVQSTIKLVRTPLLKVNENFDWSAEELVLNMKLV